MSTTSSLSSTDFELSKRLDNDIDLFMDKLVATRAKSSVDSKKEFNFDEWARDLDQHPAFMKTFETGPEGKLSEAVLALQALKNNDNAEEDRKLAANDHKIKGDRYFKAKKYHRAIECYTDGIKTLSNDQNLNAILYANRSAAHFRLGNKRTAIKDCFFARKFDSKHYKAIFRAAECLLDLNHFAQCLKWIESSDLGEIDEEMRTNLENFRCLAKNGEKSEKRDERRRNIQTQKDVGSKKRLLCALKNSKVSFSPSINFDDISLFDWSEIDVDLPQLGKSTHVYLDESNELLWPMLLQYPEFGQSDFVTDCAENSPLLLLVDKALKEPAPWDRQFRYRANNVRLFFVDRNTLRSVSIPDDWTLRQLLTCPEFVVEKGLVVLQIYARDSPL